MKLSKSLAVAAIALSCLTAGTALAQNDGGNGGNGGGGRRGGGNFDPAQFRERMMENIKEDMGVTDDSEWKAIQDRIQKVMDAQRDIGRPGTRMFRRRGGDNNNNNNDNNGARRQRRGGFGGAPNPEMEALQTAIDNKAPDAQVKAALEKYRAAQKTKEAALEKAQSNLKSVLTPKQEAIAVADGLLK